MQTAALQWYAAAFSGYHSDQQRVHYWRDHTWVDELKEESHPSTEEVGSRHTWEEGQTWCFKPLEMNFNTWISLELPILFVCIRTIFTHSLMFISNLSTFNHLGFERNNAGPYYIYLGFEVFNSVHYCNNLDFEQNNAGHYFVNNHIPFSWKRSLCVVLHFDVVDFFASDLADGTLTLADLNWKLFFEEFFLCVPKKDKSDWRF